MRKFSNSRPTQKSKKTKNTKGNSSGKWEMIQNEKRIQN